MLITPTGSSELPNAPTAVEAAIIQHQAKGTSDSAVSLNELPGVLRKIAMAAAYRPPQDAYRTAVAELPPSPAAPQPAAKQPLKPKHQLPPNAAVSLEALPRRLGGRGRRWSGKTAPSPFTTVSTNVFAVGRDLPRGMDRTIWRLEDYADLALMYEGYASAVYRGTCR